MNFANPKVDLMKRLLFIAACLVCFSGNILAQASESFDIATFRSPKGWAKQAGQDGVQFSIADKESFCLITLFRSVPSLGSPKDDFDAAWSSIVKEAVAVVTAPQMIPSDPKGEWLISGGFAPFEKNGAKGVAILYTASGFGSMMNLLVLTNTQQFEPAAAAFLESISFKKPAGSTPKSPVADVATGESIVGVWGIALSNQDSFSVNNGINGTIWRQYTFRPDGTYEFLAKLFAYTSRELLFTKETGTYQLSGNNLTVNPQKSIIQSWTKAMVADSNGRPAETDNWGKLIKTQNRTLEKVTYQIGKEYISGTEKWQLRLTADKPNQRDGPFTGSSSWPNTWFYETQRFPIKPPQ
jgi:hypothetical protein